MKLFSKALLTVVGVAVAGASVMASSAFADSYLHKIIEVPADSVSNYSYPAIEVGEAKSFALTVENPYPTSAVIEFPELGTSQYLPWFSSTTVPVDVSKQPVKFVIKHGNYGGNAAFAHVATGEIGVSSSIAEAIAAAGNSATLGAFLDNAKVSLDDLVRRNQYVAEASDPFAQDEEGLVYRSPAYTPSKRYVRGYW
jgi:hypothetical protein